MQTTFNISGSRNLAADHSDPQRLYVLHILHRPIIPFLPSAGLACINHSTILAAVSPVSMGLVW